MAKSNRVIVINIKHYQKDIASIMEGLRQLNNHDLNRTYIESIKLKGSLLVIHFTSKTELAFSGIIRSVNPETGEQTQETKCLSLYQTPFSPNFNTRLSACWNHSFCFKVYADSSDDSEINPFLSVVMGVYDLEKSYRPLGIKCDGAQLRPFVSATRSANFSLSVKCLTSINDTFILSDLDSADEKVCKLKNLLKQMILCSTGTHFESRSCSKKSDKETMNIVLGKDFKVYYERWVNLNEGESAKRFFLSEIPFRQSIFFRKIVPGDPLYQAKIFQIGQRNPCLTITAQCKGSKVTYDFACYLSEITCDEVSLIDVEVPAAVRVQNLPDQHVIKQKKRPYCSI